MRETYQVIDYDFLNYSQLLIQAFSRLNKIERFYITMKKVANIWINQNFMSHDFKRIIFYFRSNPLFF